MKNSFGKYAVLVAIVIALAVVGAAFIMNSSVLTGEKKTITIDGSYTQTVAPDKVEVTFSVVTNASTASDAQAQNTDITDAVMAALKAKGFAESDIETVYYNVYPQYDWSSGSQKITGYQATHQIKVTSNNISDAGMIVDTAINGGANEVDYIDFGLKQATEQTVRKDALSNAAQNARDKAEGIAAGLGMSIKGIVSVSEGNIYYPPYRLDYTVASAEASGTGKTVQITPGNVDVSASVSVTFELG